MNLLHLRLSSTQLAGIMTFSPAYTKGTRTATVFFVNKF